MKPRGFSVDVINTALLPVYRKRGIRSGEGGCSRYRLVDGEGYRAPKCGTPDLPMQEILEFTSNRSSVYGICRIVFPAEKKTGQFHRTFQGLSRVLNRTSAISCQRMSGFLLMLNESEAVNDAKTFAVSSNFQPEL